MLELSGLALLKLFPNILVSAHLRSRKKQILWSKIFLNKNLAKKF